MPDQLIYYYLLHIPYSLGIIGHIKFPIPRITEVSHSLRDETIHFWELD